MPIEECGQKIPQSILDEHLGIFTLQNGTTKKRNKIFSEIMTPNLHI
jgi:hypothetical protein